MWKQPKNEDTLSVKEQDNNYEDFLPEIMQVGGNGMTF